MQAVCISNRPDDFRETLAYWDIFVPWIDEVLLVCPRQLVEKMPSGGRIGIRARDEAELLGPHASRFRHSDDHQLKNLLLRMGIADSGEIDEVFLMFDDDHRPLTEISIEDFIESGRDHNYSFYNLDRWRAKDSDFDMGQHNTAQALRSHGLSTRAYAAHMPQIINKTLFQEALSAFLNEITSGTALDEWSLYFNYALDRHPESFHQPRTFATLCWPALPTDWELDLQPKRFLFENFYRQLYECNRLFGDLPTACIESEVENHSATKIARRTRIQDAYDRSSARLHRRLCWMLYRAVSRADEATNGFSRTRSFCAAITPKSIRRSLSDVVDHGKDPSFWRSYG